MNPAIPPERRAELVALVHKTVRQLMEDAVTAEVTDSEMSSYWGLLTGAMLSLGGSMEGSDWMDRIMRTSAQVVLEDDVRTQARDAGLN